MEGLSLRNANQTKMDPYQFKLQRPVIVVQKTI
jgi:hypothetical protein